MLCALVNAGLVAGQKPVRRGAAKPAAAKTSAAKTAAADPTAGQGPVVDSSVTGPVAPAPAAPVVDASVESSPTSPIPRGAHIPAQAPVAVKLLAPIDSGRLHNGDIVKATLVAPLVRSDGKVLPAGTEVELSVIAVARAGMISSAGEASVQVVRVGSVPVLSNVETVHGQEGPKILPDSAPAKGTEATLPAGAQMRFTIPPIPSA
jgi:hypothetical protein